jgi:Pyridoxine 5'-phosphate oxidase C-terminal dimerisation region
MAVSVDPAPESPVDPLPELGTWIEPVLGAPGARGRDGRPRRPGAHLAEVQESPPPCPDDWGALVVSPEAVELWVEAPDRIHERRLFRHSEAGWTVELLAP